MISGIEEARLVFAAVRASVVLEPAPALCIDIGGGSVELMIGDAAGLRWATSLPLGVGRLTAESVEDDPPGKGDRKRLDARIRAGLEALLPEIERRAPRPRGRYERNAERPRSHGRRAGVTRRRAAVEHQCVARDANRARGVARTHHAQPKSSERRRMPGLEEPRRAELLPAGSTLLVTALELFDLDGMTVSDWALREGIVLDAVGSHDPNDWSDDPRALRRASVVGLARRCNSDDGAHPARRRSRVAAVRRDEHVARARRRRPRDARVRRALARHRPARLAQRSSSARGVSRRERRAARVRTDGGRVPRRARASSPAGRTEGVRGRAAPRSIRPIASDSASSPRSCASPTVSTAGDAAGSTIYMCPSAPISSCVRLATRDDAELELWGARRRRDLFEKVFARELELSVGMSQHPGRRLNCGKGQLCGAPQNSQILHCRRRE